MLVARLYKLIHCFVSHGVIVMYATHMPVSSSFEHPNDTVPSEGIQECFGCFLFSMM